MPEAQMLQHSPTKNLHMVLGEKTFLREIKTTMKTAEQQTILLSLVVCYLKVLKYLKRRYFSYLSKKA